MPADEPEVQIKFRASTKIRDLIKKAVDRDEVIRNDQQWLLEAVVEKLRRSGLLKDPNASAIGIFDKRKGR